MAFGISNFEQLPWYIQVALEDMELQLQKTLFDTGLTNVTVATVNDKTGYSLTAGSYSVRASSSQRALATISDGAGSQDVTVASVTTTRASAVGSYRQGATGGTDATDFLCTHQLSAATTVAFVRTGTTGSKVVGVEVWELF